MSGGSQTIWCNRVESLIYIIITNNIFRFFSSKGFHLKSFRSYVLVDLSVYVYMLILYYCQIICSWWCIWMASKLECQWKIGIKVKLALILIHPSLWVLNFFCNTNLKWGGFIKDCMFSCIHLSTRYQMTSFATCLFNIFQLLSFLHR